MIAETFTRWTVRYGNRMKSQDWGIDTVNDWAEVLTELEITPKEFEEARRKAGLKTWMISHPVEFLELARGKVADSYPDIRQAYEDQANFRTDCPIAYETARRVGFIAMREKSSHITYPQWQKHYKDVCTEHSQGKEFVKPQAPQIENKTACEPASDAVSSEYLENIKALLTRSAQ